MVAGAASVPSRERLPRGGFLSAVARRLVDRHPSALPDLSAITIVLPSLTAAGDFARALSAAANRDALLLPDITTFAALAASSRGVGDAQLSPVRRELLLYGVLREHRFVERAALWQATRELSRLADDLSAWRLAPGMREEEFSTRFGAGYGTAVTAHLQFEARVAHEAWRQLGGEATRSPYSVGLMAAASAARGELWVVDPDEVRLVESEFLTAWSQRQPVYVVDADASLDDSSFARLLCAAWPDGAAEALRQRARDYRDACPAGDSRARVTCYGARTLEDEAAVAALRIRGWIAEGWQHIAIVALDRLVARRLRALLERAGILVQDDTGWALSTVAASTVIARWLDCIPAGFQIWDLLDLLKSPYLFSDADPQHRRRCAWGVEQASRARNVHAGLASVRDAVNGRAEADLVCGAIDRIAAAAAAFGSDHRSAGAWLSALRASLEQLGVTPGLQKDAAGREVLVRLDQLAQECRGDTLALGFDEWRPWLDAAFESVLFRDRDIRSPVVLTHLGGVRLRAFDAVILLGASSDQLPSHPRPGLFLNESVRSQLGLPTHAHRVRRDLEDLKAALLASDRTFITWRARRDGEPAAMGAWLEILDAFHEEVYGHGLRDDTWGSLAAAGSLSSPTGGVLPAPSRQPAPVVRERLPERVSVSAWASLVDCPYRFHARHVLALNDLDEISESIDKRDHGDLVHRILLRFHRRLPVVSEHPSAVAEATLRQITDEMFEPLSRRDGFARAWASRWRRLIPLYVALQRDREAAGWRWSEGEVVRTREIPVPGSGRVVLHGRLDRLDRQGGEGDAVLSVLDYKTQSRQALQARLKRGEDVQLSCYAVLEPRAREAAFLSLDAGEVAMVVVPDDLGAVAAAEFDRLSAVFAAVRQGAPLVANGDDTACRHCEMRAICRRDHWSDR